MKRGKNFVTMLAAAVALFLIPGSSSLQAHAAEPVTYSVKYVAEDQDWQYRADTPEFEDPDYYRELYYMQQSIKDGDVVVLYYDGSASSSPVLDLGNVRLSNLTIAQSDSFSMVQAGNIDDCFVLAGTSCAINSNITNAYVYDSAVCNFNKDVKELLLSYTEDSGIRSTIGCSGTVGHFRAYSPDKTHYEFYNFQADSFYLENGELLTPDWQCSKTPSQTTPSQTTTPRPSNPSSTTSDEYDSVPKTGDTNPITWLLCLAALSLAGSFGISSLKKKAN